MVRVTYFPYHHIGDFLPGGDGLIIGIGLSAACIGADKILTYKDKADYKDMIVITVMLPKHTSIVVRQQQVKG